MNYFFSQLTRSIGVFFRTLRAFFSRKLMGITTMFRRMTNFSRHATKVASSSLQGVVSAAQKPTSQSDYVETGRLYISKALIIRLILGLAAVALIGYFVVWPFILSHFLTARFYQEDKKVAGWSGRVIVYSDEKKTLPLYSGRLEDGVLQGEAKLYDGEGVLLYEGMITDGLRSGSGKEYENGILSYEGQFEAGMYSGRGRRYDDGKLIYDGQFVEGLRSGSGTAYENGKVLYEGQFMDDLYEGRGKLYENGALSYDGSFHAGAAEGSGTSYYPSGKVAYQGQFLAGKADGTGTAFAESGRKLYAGGFAEGAYGGEGTLFFSDGGQLEGIFQNGSPTGNVEWKKNGLLYYQGEWSDDAPSGFGTLYNKAGKKLYEGPFLGGTIDGAALLDYSTEELRAVFGESIVKNENDGAAFRMIVEELGISALCTYQSESEESRVYQIYLSAPEKGDWVSMLPGAAHTKAVQWPLGVTPEQNTIYFIGQMGVNVAAGAYPGENAAYEARRTTVLYANEQRKQAVLLTWARSDVVPEPMKLGDDGKDSKVEKLLDAMDKMIDGEGTAASAGASFGGAATDGAFQEMGSLAEAAGLADAMLDFWQESQRLDALEDIYDRNETLLEDARNEAAKGVGSLERVNALQQEQTDMKTKIETAKTAIKRAELQASTVGVEGLGDFALEEMLVSFNPAEQDVSGLALFATTYAEMTGSGEDPEAIRTAVKEGLLNLSDAHGAAKLALSRHQTAEEATESAKQSYAMGLGTKEAWYDAMNEETLARVELCAALAEFSKQANQFNQLTGGWVSRTFNWHKDAFEPLFQAEIPSEEAPPEDGGEGGGEDPAPAEGEEPALTEGEEPAPAEGEEPAPEEGEDPAPAEGEDPAPTEGEEPEANPEEKAAEAA